MYTMRDLQQATGFSRDQLRDRLGLLGATVGDDQHRGARNAILVGDKTMTLLRRMQELESGEVGPQEAATRIIKEVSGNGNRPGGLDSINASGDPQLSPTPPNWIDKLLAEKDQRIRELKDRIVFLEAQIEVLTPLALPRPRRLFRMFRRRGGNDES